MIVPIPDSNKGRVLVVDDEQSTCELLEVMLRRLGHEVEWRTSAHDAIELVAERDFDVILTDLGMAALSGTELCERILGVRPDVPVIVVTGDASMSAAVGAIRAGAYDFITKPVDAELLALSVSRALQHGRLRKEVKLLRQAVTETQRFGALVGESTAMRRVFDLMARVAGSDASVMILGESGTGKELIARAIHDASPRRDGPFLAVDCAAMPPTLLESELFGHTRGAFTDARAARVGLFEQATGGTLFLDEIGELALEMQPKLLRALQERKVRPIGGNTEVAFDARIVTATNRDLEAAVDEKRFREDLYYRINVVRVDVPPLRERAGDVAAARAALPLAVRRALRQADPRHPPRGGREARLVRVAGERARARELHGARRGAPPLRGRDDRGSAREDPAVPRRPARLRDGRRLHGAEHRRARAPLHPARARARRRQQIARGRPARAGSPHALPPDRALWKTW